MCRESEKSTDAIEKIRKLLKLSESPYEGEAKTALEKARKLMVQFHIEENDLDEKQKNGVILEEYRISEAMVGIWSYIAKNNRCMCYMQDKNLPDGKRGHFMIIVGFKFDIECVKMMVDYIEDCFNAGLKNIRRKIRCGDTVTINGNVFRFDKHESMVGLKNAYLNGFTKGLKEIIEEQNAKSEYHLMVSTPEEVKDEYKERTRNLEMGTYISRRKWYINNNTDLIDKISHQDGRYAGKRREFAH